MLSPRSLIIAGLVAVIALVAAMPAAAADLRATVFNKSKPAGEGSLTIDRRAGGGFALTACDTAKDGAGITTLAWSDQQGIPVAVSDRNGAHNGCKVRHVDLRGRRIFMKVCRQDRDGNVDRRRLEACSPIRTTTN